MIQLKDINKIYDDGFQALENINLTLEEGKINVLIGPSGCGKTTTMKLLNRLTEYTDGEILVDGESIQDLNPIEIRRKMGYVIQNIGLFPHMSIYDNVATVPKLLKWDKRKIKQKVHDLLHMVNLDPETYKGRYPSELSGGQQQRIGVIRALAAEPSTILMDEPFSALDPISREQLQDELVRLQEEINKTIVFVTHDMDEAIKIADQIILMKDGHIVQKGTPHDILANPANDFVKEFLGEDRLGSTLPSTSTFVNYNYPTITTDQTTNEAIEQMTSEQIDQLPVLDGDNRLQGMVQLYDLFRQQDQLIEAVMMNTNQHISEETETNQLVDIFTQKKEKYLPYVAKDGKFIGMIEQQQVFNSLQEFYRSKRGGQ
ncbi:glycine betaine/L-proline ABC transporter ATPase subunit [Gracilibacillus halophilus YIM-C55.5]|uniref:Quaternary amine transport ATP-binding protein n=1 Tax=Gracilibacillus halophilus YIM-C55.5 TaxID=1308866 RepID=N4W9A5_9BACI|nr:betaine/proline/choline family ABC transporter ATP-binding protein [Gracilibacillus halophilus]ENH95829.1 glycine betaine/L-proline ABC transporter ATPase subunit [Gracilibacillus halophilus YIM-C55.5]